MNGESGNNQGEQLGFSNEELGITIKPEVTPSKDVEFTPAEIPKIEKSDLEGIEINQRLELFLHTQFNLHGRGNFVDHIDQLYKDREKHGASTIPVKAEEKGLFEVFIEKFPTFRERDQLRIALEREMRKVEKERQEAEKAYDMADKAGVVYDTSYSHITNRLERLENSYRYIVEEVEEKLEERAKYFEQKKNEVLAEFENQSHLLTIGRESREMTLRQATMIVFKEWRALEGESYPKESYKKSKEDLLDCLYKYFKDSTDRKLLVLGLNDKAVECKSKLQSLEKAREKDEESVDEYELRQAGRDYQEQNEFAHFISILLKIEII